MGNSAWTTPPNPNDVDIFSNDPPCGGCCTGFVFEGQPVPPELSPYLSQDQFNDGLEKVNVRNKRDQCIGCAVCWFCLLVGGPMTFGIGFIICCVGIWWIDKKGNQYIEAKALEGWKQQGLGVKWTSGDPGDAGDAKTGRPPRPSHPARIRVTRPMNPQPEASLVGQPVTVQAPRTMQIAIPAGTAPGSILQATTPDGVTIQVTVPEGAGSNMTVAY